jgi:hypothetical protein
VSQSGVVMTRLKQTYCAWSTSASPSGPSPRPFKCSTIALKEQESGVGAAAVIVVHNQALL